MRDVTNRSGNLHPTNVLVLARWLPSAKLLLRPAPDLPWATLSPRSPRSLRGAPSTRLFPSIATAPGWSMLGTHSACLLLPSATDWPMRTYSAAVFMRSCRSTDRLCSANVLLVAGASMPA